MHFLGSTTGCIQAITACTKVQGTFNPTQDQKNLLLRKKQNETHIVFTYWCCLCHFNTSWLLRDTQPEHLRHLRIGSKSRNQVMPGFVTSEKSTWHPSFTFMSGSADLLHPIFPCSSQMFQVYPTFTNFHHPNLLRKPWYLPANISCPELKQTLRIAQGCPVTWRW